MNQEYASTIGHLYSKEKISLGEIGRRFNKSANQIRRDLLKLGYVMRTKSEAQKLALDTGRVKHPTKGKTLSVETKKKISAGLSDVWDSMTASKRKIVSEKHKEKWESLTDKQKQDFAAKGHAGVRAAAKDGSKFEHFIFNALISAGISVQRHRENLIPNSKMHVDMFVAESNTIIEVDGPSHFKEIWGRKALIRQKKSDLDKNGLFLSAGFNVIRIMQKKRYVSINGRDRAVKYILDNLGNLKNSKSMSLEYEVK